MSVKPLTHPCRWDRWFVAAVHRAATTTDVHRVVVYHAPECHLCERALATVRGLQEELGFQLDEVEITGDDELEARYREWLPVVEIDGERAFTYFVPEEGFRRRLARS